MNTLTRLFAGGTAAPLPSPKASRTGKGTATASALLGHSVGRIADEAISDADKVFFTKFRNAYLVLSRTEFAKSLTEKIQEALESSGFNHYQLEALQRTANAQNAFLFERPRNTQTEAAEIAALLFDWCTTNKPMSQKSKSGATGDSRAAEASVRVLRLQSSRDAPERVLTDEELIRLQKSAELSNEPGLMRLDILHLFVETGRLKPPVLIKQILRISKQAAASVIDYSVPVQDIESYYLKFEFTYTHLSSKSKQIMVRIPAEWLKPEAVPLTFHEKEILAEPEYGQRLKEINDANTKLAAAASAKIHAETTEVRLADLPPADLFRAKHFDQSDAYWNRIFGNYHWMHDFFVDDLFERGPGRHVTDRLKPSVETARLTQHDFVEGKQIYAPWPIVQKMKRIPMVDDNSSAIIKLVNFLTISDMDGAAYAYRIDDLRDLDVDDFARFGSKTVTGMGTRKDMEVTHALNTHFLEVLQESFKFIQKKKNQYACRIKSP